MATGKVSRLLISTRHLIIEYSKKGLSAVHIQRLLHHKHNVTITRQSIFKLVKRHSSTGVLAPATRRDNNRFPRKLKDFHRRCIDMWLRHNSELTSQALVDRLFPVFDVRVTTWYMSKVRKALGWCTRTLQYCQLNSHKNKLCGVQWSLDALRCKETCDNVIFTDETSVEMGADGKLFFTRELQIWIVCQLKR
jgi:transposase